MSPKSSVIVPVVHAEIPMVTSSKTPKTQSLRSFHRISILGKFAPFLYHFFIWTPHLSNALRQLLAILQRLLSLLQILLGSRALTLGNGNLLLKLLDRPSNPSDEGAKHCLGLFKCRLLMIMGNEGLGFTVSSF